MTTCEIAGSAKASALRASSVRAVARSPSCSWRAPQQLCPSGTETSNPAAWRRRIVSRFTSWKRTDMMQPSRSATRPLLSPEAGESGGSGARRRTTRISWPCRISASCGNARICVATLPRRRARMRGAVARGRGVAKRRDEIIALVAQAEREPHPNGPSPRKVALEGEHAPPEGAELEVGLDRELGRPGAGIERLGGESAGGRGAQHQGGERAPGPGVHGASVGMAARDEGLPAPGRASAGQRRYPGRALGVPGDRAPALGLVARRGVGRPARPRARRRGPAPRAGAGSWRGPRSS